MAKLLKRIDGMDWNAVKNLGFQHVDGTLYRVDDDALAAKLVEEQPKCWAPAERADLEELNAPRHPEGTPKPESPGGTITSESHPALMGAAEADEADEQRAATEPQTETPLEESEPEPEEEEIDGAADEDEDDDEDEED